MCPIDLSRQREWYTMSNYHPSPKSRNGADRLNRVRLAQYTNQRLELNSDVSNRFISSNGVVHHVQLPSFTKVQEWCRQTEQSQTGSIHQSTLRTQF